MSDYGMSDRDMSEPSMNGDDRLATQNAVIRQYGGRRYGRFVVIDGDGPSPTEVVLTRAEGVLTFAQDRDGNQTDYEARLGDQFETVTAFMDVVNDDFDPRGIA